MTEHKIDVRVTLSDRKSMKMTVKADGSVLVEAPKAMSKKQITAIIDQKILDSEQSNSKKIFRDFI